MPGRPELLGGFGAVSSTHWLATAAGMAALERGGNAFDAAVTAGFVLQVVEPHSNGFGGDVSIVLHEARPGRTAVVCGQGPMPRTATTAAFAGLGLNQIPGSGLLAACVPGAFGGWLRLLAEHGTISAADALAPAIGYAESGFPLPADSQKAIAALVPLFAEHWPGSGRAFLHHGVAPATGARMRNPELAATLRRLAAEGEQARGDREAKIEATIDAFYRGFVAEAMDDYLGRTEVLDSTGRRHRAFLRGDDLDRWHATVEEPVSLRYRDLTVHKPGPWSQGPVFLQQLALLEDIDLAGMDPGSGRYLHTIVESAKLAMADREAWYGDPDFVPDRLGELLDPARIARRRALIGEHALPDPAPSVIGGVSGWVPDVLPDEPPSCESDWMGQLQSGMPTVVLRAMVKSGDTCSVTVADRHGNLVAGVPSGGWLKSSPVIPGLGFPLGTRGQTLWLVDGHPNSLMPGKRPRTTLSPSIALREGKPYLAFGTPGGDRQDVWTLESFLAVTEFGADLQSATETTMFHSDHFPPSFTPRRCRPGTVVLEDNCGPEAVADLRARGHDVELVAPYSMGSKVCMVGVGEDGFLRAGAGPRGKQAYAVCR
ncbi:gamma-glutamyltransferase family protein [Amycolatopsis azurea]|uniref:gamma-glutamyltransferase family protein n=1 Tax=Amycolatopsis azurea TaxID=36819 RepID=UPI00381D4281